MGLVRWEVGILAQRATIPSKGLFMFTVCNSHTCADYSLYMLLICFLCYLYFSPPQITNKPRDGGTEHAFILGPVNSVANMHFIPVLKSNHLLLVFTFV
jgi:hypothetical protein